MTYDDLKEEDKEFRLCDINFHTEVDLLHAGAYEKVLEMAKTW